ncbi:hypothetical protein KSP39_PZI008565 [Platanthera zijinensis]|uniref:PRA1 family protein n=1 Tax=Platanthera zijinensis TaxID=2320716 RepID=A0AAP0BN34_9ASPA
MAGHGAMLRPSAAFWAAKEATERARRSARRAITRFARPGAFSLPAGRRAAASRAFRNLAAFRSHYALLLWISLLSFLFHSHRATVLFLMVVSKVALSYAVVLRIFPNSVLLQRILDRRVVVALFLALVIVKVVLAGAVANLLLSLAAAIPIILAHAVFRSPDDPSTAGAAENGKPSGELTPLSEKKDSDLESSGAQGSDRSS